MRPARRGAKRQNDTDNINWHSICNNSRKYNNMTEKQEKTIRANTALFEAYDKIELAAELNDSSFEEIIKTLELLFQIKNSNKWKKMHG